MKTAIIGGGPAGLLTSYYLATNNCDTTVFEEHVMIGYPKHCTGLVTARSIEKIPIDIAECIEKQFNTLIIHGPSKKSIEINTQTVAKINRVCFEEKIYTEARKEGVDFRLGVRVEAKRTKNTLETLSLKDKFDFYIDARGFEAAIKHSEKVRQNKLIGINIILHGRTRLDNDSIHVFFDNEITPGFFAWLIPLRNQRILIGGGFRNPTSPYKIIRYFHKKGYITSHEGIIEKYGGVILRGPPIRDFQGKNWIAIGDSISMVKPITGGGLYPIINSIPFKYRNINCEDALIYLVKEIRKTILKLEKQYLLSRFIHTKTFTYTLDIAIPFIKKTIPKLHLDYDEHDKLITQLLGNLITRNVYPA